MRSLEYLQYLDSQHWSDLRLEAINRSNRRCEACQKPGKLDGHHLIYPDNLKSCTVDDIMALCRRCHDLWHNHLKSKRMHVHDFCRETTKNGIAVLLNPIQAPRPKKKKRIVSNYRGKPTKKAVVRELVSEIEASSEFQSALLMGREKFKKFCRIHYKNTGKSWNRLSSSLVQIYDNKHK